MLDDFRTACRRLRHAPLFTASAITIIALAIGANAAIFGVADAVLFRPLPYADPDRIFVVRLADARSGESLPFTPVPIEYVQVIAEHHRGIAGIGMRSTEVVGTRAGEEAEFFSAISVTPARQGYSGGSPSSFAATARQAVIRSRTSRSSASNAPSYSARFRRS
jgi:hypothetical protein